MKTPRSRTALANKIVASTVGKSNLPRYHKNMGSIAQDFPASAGDSKITVSFVRL